MADKPNPASPVSGKVFTPEERSRGGKTQTLFKQLASNLASRRTCSMKCTFFETCPVSAMSYSWEAKKGADPSKDWDRMCLMKQFPSEVRTQFINLFLSGEEGIVRVIKDAMFSYMNDVNLRGTIRDKHAMIGLMLDFYKTIYISKKSVGQTKEPLTITIRRVGMQQSESITLTPQDALPEGVTACQIFSPQNLDETEHDAESLFTSPNLERIIRSGPRVIAEEIKIESNMDAIINDGEKEDYDFNDD